MRLANIPDLDFADEGRDQFLPMGQGAKINIGELPKEVSRNRHRFPWGDVRKIDNGFLFRNSGGDFFLTNEELTNRRCTLSSLTVDIIKLTPSDFSTNASCN
jgi:hypothetical protein